MFSFEPLTLFIAVWFFWFVVDTQTHNYFLILKSTKKKKKAQTAVCDSDLHLNTRIVITSNLPSSCVSSHFCLAPFFSYFIFTEETSGS